MTADPREAAWDAAIECFVEGYLLLDTLPVEEAAQRAWTPTGPPIPELEARIRARRTELHLTPAPAVVAPVPRRERDPSPRRKTA